MSSWVGALLLRRGVRWVRVSAALAGLVACAPVELLTSTGPTACVEDHECGVARLCVGGVCTECPSLEGCMEPEPRGKWTPLTRNGCTVCEFAPASACAGPSECEGTCYRGARCATGCTRAECCANVCAPAGCTAPAPLGCKAPCGAEMSTCAVCVAASCRCEEGAWRCDVGCADLASFCVYEP
jgi:hypothetical protein